MQGCMVICTEHQQVYNAERQIWQVVSQEVLDELKGMSQEVGNVDVHEGCCGTCSQIASNSFHALYRMKYSAAAYQEVGSEVKLPWKDDEK